MGKLKPQSKINKSKQKCHDESSLKTFNMAFNMSGHITWSFVESVLHKALGRPLVVNASRYGNPAMMSYKMQMAHLTVILHLLPSKGQVSVAIKINLLNK